MSIDGRGSIAEISEAVALSYWLAPDKKALSAAEGEIISGRF